jgi:thiaminase/transcriptional activator TenA
LKERFSEHLRRLADPIWRKQHEHPFVIGIGEGSLELEKFRYWIRQDYLFLIEYCRLFAMSAARAPDLDTLTKFAELLHATATTEMDLHRALAEDFGISRRDLEDQAMAPATQSYTEFLIRTAATKDFGEVAAALLPCMWAFSEIGLALSARGRPADPRLAAWIDSYANPEFTALSDWCRQLVDRLGDETSEAGRSRMETAFLTSSAYELAFWDMAWEAGRDPNPHA